MKTTALALLAGLILAAPAAVADEARSIPVQVEKSAPTPAPDPEAARYADREGEGKDAQELEGGASLVLFSGAALVALIVLLLVI